VCGTGEVELGCPRAVANAPRDSVSIVVDDLRIAGDEVKRFEPQRRELPADLHDAKKSYKKRTDSDSRNRAPVVSIQPA